MLKCPMNRELPCECPVSLPYKHRQQQAAVCGLQTLLFPYAVIMMFKAWRSIGSPAGFPVLVTPALKWELCCSIQEDGETG